MKTPRLDDLAPAPYNPRRIKDRNFEALGYSLEEFGDLSGITWNQRTGNLVTGHQRLRSLKERHGDGLKMRRGVIHAGAETFRVRVVNWPIEKEKAANIAANSPLLAGVFTTDLAGLVAELDTAMPELAGDLLLHQLLTSLGMAPDVDVTEDEIPDLPKKATTKPGDLRSACGASYPATSRFIRFGTRSSRGWRIAPTRR